MVNTINSQVQVNTQPETNRSIKPSLKDKAIEGKHSESNQNQMDSVTLQQSNEPPATYAPSVATDELTHKSYEMLRKLVTNMLKEQGIDFKVATGESDIDISQLSQDEAMELVSEDGYFGAEQTSDRIVEFGIAAAGGDPSKLEAIKEGVQKGFDEALEAFGGALPDISYETLDAAMEKLDAWATEAGREEA